MQVAKRYLPPDQRLPFDEFGLFYGRNGTTAGLLNVFTGQLGVDDLYKVSEFNGLPELTFWPKTLDGQSTGCNQLNGTDGTAYPPHIDQSTVLYFFNSAFCRSIPLVYNNTVEHAGLSTYRYVQCIYINILLGLSKL